jgi:hypothetical protein
MGAGGRKKDQRHDGRGLRAPAWERTPWRAVQGAARVWHLRRAGQRVTSSRAILCALELPSHKALEVDVVRGHSGHGLVACESDRKFHLILGHGLLADDADDADPRTTPCPDGLSRRQLSTPDRVTSLVSEERFVRHVRSPGSGGVVMPDARRPGRLLASPGEPDGRQHKSISSLETALNG